MDLINIFTKLPKFLNNDYSIEEIFNIIKDEFRSELDFDFTLIGYLNANGIEIKDMSKPNKNILFTSENIIFYCFIT